MLELNTHAEVMDKALKAEWIREQRSSDKKAKDKKRPRTDDRQEDKKEETNYENSSKFEGRCPKCRRKHEEKDCPMITGSCFHCKKKGHKAASCPERS